MLLSMFIIEFYIHTAWEDGETYPKFWSVCALDPVEPKFWGNFPNQKSDENA